MTNYQGAYNRLVSRLGAALGLGLVACGIITAADWVAALGCISLVVATHYA